MKVKAWTEGPIEVEADIDIADMYRAMIVAADPDFNIMRAIHALANVIEHAKVEDFSPSHRENIFRFFEEQAHRFRPEKEEK